MDASLALHGSAHAGMDSVVILAMQEQHAKDAIRLARAWLKANGIAYKLVYFKESHVRMGSKRRVYEAKICFVADRALALAA